MRRVPRVVPLRRFFTSPRLSHLEHTAHPPRVGAEASATIAQISRLSPLTTELQLRVDTHDIRSPFTFEPGQWVDFYIPDIDKIGGYSITSMPSELPRLDLVIKTSAHPPAAWCTQIAAVGDRVTLHVGGKFVLQQAQSNLFVAGGVGINPLYSMLRVLCSSESNQKVALLYTAKTHEELIFRAHLEEIAKRLPQRTRFWLGATQDPIWLGQSTSVAAAPGVSGYADGRIGEANIEAALRWLGTEPNAVREGFVVLYVLRHTDLMRTLRTLLTSTSQVCEGFAVPWRPDCPARKQGTASESAAGVAAYVCGPPNMTDDIMSAIRYMGVPNVYSEQWW